MELTREEVEQQCRILYVADGRYVDDNAVRAMDKIQSHDAALRQRAEAAERENRLHLMNTSQLVSYILEHERGAIERDSPAGRRGRNSGELVTNPASPLECRKLKVIAG